MATTSRSTSRSTTRRGLSAALTALATLALLIGGLQHASPLVTKPVSERTHASKVLVVVMENHSYRQMRSGMPNLFRLSRKYGYATRWTAIRHPSLPNYLAITGGSTFGVTDDAPPRQRARLVGSARSVFDQALGAGRTARTYAQSMPAGSTCRLTDHRRRTGSYVVRHNPWTYYGASRARCRRYDVPASGFAADARSNRLPDVGFLIPNTCGDAHDCSLSTADSRLKKLLGPVLGSSDFTSGRLVVVVTADEDDRKSGNRVLTSVLTPRLHGKVVSRHLTHYSLTRYIAQTLGVRPLRHGRTAPNMRRAFGL